jgi:chemotaxis protein MotB
MDEAKVLRVVGLSSAVLFDKKDAFNPINRRISIIVMNKKTEESALKESAAVEVSNEAQARQELAGGAAK